ncbi:deleted in malignant brain tumors 1 protein-like isoform X4 [Halichondria panicea]|uniref:deleted in malignant brain tumors 1 protein-like isoform X4 n=1 Tax=Halichondria panicea TaxID=6063 RepID=UPI00312BA780
MCSHTKHFLLCWWFIVQLLGLGKCQCSDGDARLIQQETDYLCGRLEVCHSGVWGTVCDNGMDINVAQAACQQLSAGNATNISGDALLGEGTGSIFDISCTNYSMSLLNCSITDSLSCSLHTNDVSICCSFECTDDDIRLLDGGVPSRGRIETCRNNKWAVLCQDLLTDTTASDVCNSLDYSPYGAVSVNGAYFVWSRASTTLIRAHDGGNCVERGQYQGVICQAKSTVAGNCSHGAMRLVDLVDDHTTMTRVGRVEVCVNNAWGSVCKNSFNSPEADVVCNRIPGFTGVGAIVSVGNGTSPIFLDSLQCIGTETSLVDCADELRPVGITNCQKDNVVIVQCADLNECASGDPCPGEGALCQNSFMNYTCGCAQGYVLTDNGTCVSTACSNGEIRLMIGEDEDSPDYGAIEPNFFVVNSSDVLRAGRVEVCVDGVYGTICQDGNWGNNDASVVCSQLGFSPYGAFPLTSSDSLFLEGSLPALLGGLDCAGNETDIFDCQRSDDTSATSCDRFQDARVVCHSTSYLLLNESAECNDGALRLTGGSSTRGRLEVCVNNAWGTVCSHGFNENAANVACASLGDYTALPVFENLTELRGLSDAPIFLSSVSCEGSEESLLQCKSTLPAGLYIPSLCYSTVGLECQDIDECLNASLNNCSQRCMNTMGSFYCYCDSGYEGSADCIDIDECSLSLDNCSKFATCDNTEGGFDCSCRRGYEGNGFACADMCIMGQTRLLLGDRNQYITNTLPPWLKNIEEFFTYNDILLAGRVEYCSSGGSYDTLCGDSWTNKEASIVCRTLGLSPYGAVAVTNGGFRQETLPLPPLLTVNCDQSESTLSECVFSNAVDMCTNRGVGVVCQVPSTINDTCTTGDLRLVEGAHELEGRLEVCVNRAWGTVCSDGFSESDANVVCSQLGPRYNGVLVHPNAGVFGAGTGPIFLDNLACSGDEETLLQCDFYSRSVGLHDCLHSQDVGVTCRDFNECSTDNGGCEYACNNLVGFPYYNCSCQLGYILNSDNKSCIDIDECEVTISCHDNATCSNTNGSYICECNDGFFGDGITCDIVACFEGDVRLGDIVDSVSSSVVGRVEVCFNHTYGTICGDGWSNAEASVVCKQLGFSSYGAVPLTRGQFGTLMPPDILASTECRGNEESLLQCNYSTDTSGCDRFNDAGVACQNITEENTNTTCMNGEIRVVTSNTSQQSIEGRVEVCLNNAWGSVCGDSYFDSVDAGVLCGQLGKYSRDSAEIVSGSPGTGPIFVDRLECSADDQTLSDCRMTSPLGVVDRLCDHSMDISIRCIDIDECSNYTLNNCSQTCLNVRDGYECSCKTGYRLLPDNVTCEAIDACLSMELNNCSSNAKCNSTSTAPGTFECTCFKGYEGNGVSCENINECEDQFFCGNNAMCFDTEGSYCCMCAVGFYPISVECGNTTLICDDIDECAQNETNTCDIMNGYCNNTQGGYECLCNFGYSSNTTMNNTCRCEEGQVVLLSDSQPPSVDQTEGRVEVCINNSYTAVCDDLWDELEALIICRQLGFNVSIHEVVAVKEAAGQYGAGNATIILDDLSCSGEERNLLQCELGGPRLHTCDISEVAGVQCGVTCINGSIRLAVGDDIDLFVDTMTKEELVYIDDTLSEGRVEICMDGRYGTICADGDSWSFNEAAVVCRQLGFTANGASPVGSGFFSTDTRATLFDRVTCSESEVNVMQCARKPFTGEQCSHDAAVICQDPATVDASATQCINSHVMLFGNRLNNTGRAQICINNVWGTICDNGISSSELRVICRQWGPYSEGAILLHDSPFGLGSGPVFLQFSGSRCDGSEENLLDCDHRPLSLTTPLCSDHANDVAVVCPLCDPDTNQPCLQQTGPNSMCIYNSTTSYSCGCRPGFQGENCDDINECDTDDGSCHNCENTDGSYTCNCSHGFELMSIKDRKFCQDINECETLEAVCNGSTFCKNTDGGYVCTCNEGYKVDDNNTCHDINECEEGGIHNCSEYATCDNTIGGFNCTCQFKYSGDGFSCGCAEGDIRLMNGSVPSEGQSEGRVEVCRGGVFGTVCDRYWNDLNARVVCHRLGFSGKDHAAIRRTLTNKLYGKAPNLSQIHMDKVLCRGNETSLLSCQNSQNISDCRHVDVASVKCEVPCFEGDIRLIPDEESSEAFYTKLRENNNVEKEFIFYNGRLRLGRVEICHDRSYTTVCRDNWDNLDASVVCSQLGFSPNGAVVGPSKFTQRQLAVSLIDVNCTGKEAHLTDCDSESSSVCVGGDDADVVCQGVETVKFTEENCSHGDIRLINDGVPHLFEGRLEVCVNNVWGTVCEIGFDRLDAQVVCMMAGFSAGRNHMFSTMYGPGKGPIFLSRLDCAGTEDSIFDCNTFDFSSLHNCNHNQDISVICESTCPEIEEIGSFGTYLWLGDIVAKQTISIPCELNCSGVIVGREAIKTCDESGKWEDTNYSACPTANTCYLQNQIQELTAQNANSVVADVSATISRSDDEDQSSVTIKVLSELFEHFAGQPPLPEEAVQDLVGILSDVSNWTLDALQDDAPSMVETFESIFNNFDFTTTGITTSSPSVAYIGREVSLQSLQQSGQMFSLNDAGPSFTARSSSMSISLPPSVFSKFSSPNIRLSFSAFSDANLFPLSPQTNRNPRFQIGSPVIGANILDQALVGNVTISMILSNTNYRAPICSFWDSDSSLGTGTWSNEGCSLVTYDENSGLVECTCNHLTNFGLLANTNPVSCLPNTHEPNEDFTECIPRTPNVTLGNYSSSVDYGNVLLIVCETSPLFRVEWRYKNGTLVERSFNDGPPSDYAGHLYSFRNSTSRVDLRTLVFSNSNMDRIDIGFQDVQNEISRMYECVASNFEVTNTSVTVTPRPRTAEGRPSFMRFSTDPNMLMRFELNPPALFAGYISNQIVSEVDEITAAQCRPLPDGRRMEDVENSWDRYDCILTSSSDSTVITNAASNVLQRLRYPVVVKDSVNVSNQGFCDSEINNTVLHGVYSWTETEVGGKNSFLCYYRSLNAPNSTATVARICNGHRMWSTYTPGECISETTFEFQRISQIGITSENIEMVVEQLANAVSFAATDMRDQISDNAAVVSSTLSSAATVVTSGNFSINIPFLTNVSGVVSAISIWPSKAIRNSSTEVVSSFDTFAENLVSQENFTNNTIEQPQLLFRGQQGNLSTLRQVGFVFDVSALDLMTAVNNSYNDTSPPAYNKVTVMLPSEVFKQTESTGLAFSVYPNSSLFPLDEYLDSVGLIVGTPVVGAIVANTFISNLTLPVTITLPIIVNTENYTRTNPTHCVSWNFTTGNWSTDGCSVLDSNITNGSISCQCNHLTNFAIIMNIQARLSPRKSDEVLDAISYIGSVLSIIGLIITIITLTGSNTSTRICNSRSWNTELRK